MGKGGGGGTAAGWHGEQAAMNIMQSTGKARRLVFQQLNEALTSGNIGARVPLIQNMVEGGLQQGSQALRMAEEGIAKSGAARSPIGKEMLATTRASAQQAVSAIPSEVISQSIAQGPEAVSGITQTAMGLLGVSGQAAGAAAQAKAANQAQTMGAAGAGVSAAVAIIAAI